MAAIGQPVMPWLTVTSNGGVASIRLNSVVGDWGGAHRAWPGPVGPGPVGRLPGRFASVRAGPGPPGR